MFGSYRDAQISYHRVEDDEKLSEDSDLTIQAANECTKVWPYVLPWVLTSAAFAYLSLYFYLSSLKPTYDTFEGGWSTDFKPAREYVEKRLDVFTGSPTFLPNGTYSVLNPDPITYIGDPSDEIDRAWEELTWGRYILITKEEAEDALRRDYPDDDLEGFWSPRRGGYDVGLDMFHTLHCLNRLRRALSPDYYPTDAPGDHKNLAIHQGHCIEQIRQYITCAGDMTIVPTRFHEQRKKNYVESDVTHTCRNFRPLREFLTERYNGSLAVQPVCSHGTFEEEGSRSCIIPEDAGFPL